MPHIRRRHQNFNVPKQKARPQGSLPFRPRLKQIRSRSRYRFMAMVSPSMVSTVVTILELAW